MFLRNFWYVAATDSEVGRKPLARLILGEPIVFFRTEDGKPVAFEDRCAHRHLPLSMGKLVGDRLQCHYHGLQYDQTGPMRAHSRPGPDPAERQGEDLSGGRALSLGVDLDGRSGASPIPPRSPISIGSTIPLGCESVLPAREGELAARRRQPARPHPFGLRA